MCSLSPLALKSLGLYRDFETQRHISGHSGPTMILGALPGIEPLLCVIQALGFQFLVSLPHTAPPRKQHYSSLPGGDTVVRENGESPVETQLLPTPTSMFLLPTGLKQSNLLPSLGRD